MQNKGFVKVFAVLLTLVCVFYLSFSFVTRHYTNKAKEFAKGDVKVEQDYLDSLSNEKVWLGNYTLKQCREMEISLGLDLKGGMNVILEVSVPDVIKALADNKPDEAFNKALAEAAKQATTSQDDVITLFIKEYHKTAPGAKLSELFATQQLKDKVNQKSSDAEVEKVLREEVKAAVTNSYNVLRTRIDRFGVVQPNIQSLEDKMGRIMVELPGIKEPERVRKLLQGSANLEFWETYNAKEVAPYLQAADSKLRAVLAHETTANDTVAAVDSTATAVAEATADQAISAADSLAAALKGGEKKQQASSADLEQLKKEHPLLAILSVNPNGGPVVGYANYKDTATVNSYLAMKEIAAELPKDLRLKWGVSPFEYDPKGQTFELYAIKSTERNGKAPLEGDVVTDAKDDYDQYGKPSVSMSMNSDGARRWALLTKQNINKSIAIVLDNYVYSAPNVSNEITGGNSQITGHFTPEQAKDLANVLKSGKMPAPAHIVQEDIVGPSLGQESINAGIFSFVVALILLMIYMCSMYGFIPGMIANGALVLNFFFTLGILSSFQAALTMSGIAGMVLSLGMAVDANVLIYERTKEELRAGKSLGKAIADGYSNAFSAIFDSNLTSIITGIVLFYFGTGPIRGFATTMIIGLFASFLTAVFLTRIVYEALLAKDKLKNVTFTTSLTKDLLTNPKINFLGARKVGYLIPAAIIVLGAISMMTIGLNNGIDFTGGRNYVIRFNQEVKTDDVRNMLDAQLDGSVSVIQIGTADQVRVSTNYKIDDNDPTVDQEIENKLFEGVKSLLPEGTTLDEFTTTFIQSSQKVGPSMADDIKNSAILAVIFAMICMAAYILLRFRDVSFSVGAFASVATTTLCIISFYTLLWKVLPFSMEVDQTFIAAILTIIGYSINDTVVVFDRIRETIALYPKRDRYQVINDALNSTLCRTFNTSLTTLVVVLCIFILGGSTIRSFTFAILLGIIIGTYSTLFVATPIAYELQKKKINKKAAAEKAGK